MNDEPRILILETSGRVGLVAVARRETLGELRRLEESRRHARDLAPAVAELCQTQGWKPRDLDAVIVSLGPGSYTGLRVGIMSAKALAYATGCKLIGVETFAAIAAQTPGEAATVDVIADAQQKKLYVQSWRRDGSRWQPETPLEIKPASEWLASLSPGTWISGPGLRPWEESIPAANKVVEPDLREPHPKSLLMLGLERWNQGQFDDFWKVEPIYLRRSNAEENWEVAGKDRNESGGQGETSSQPPK